MDLKNNELFTTFLDYAKRLYSDREVIVDDILSIALFWLDGLENNNPPAMELLSDDNCRFLKIKRRLLNSLKVDFSQLAEFVNENSEKISVSQYQAGRAKHKLALELAEKRAISRSASSINIADYLCAFFNTETFSGLLVAFAKKETNTDGYVDFICVKDNVFEDVKYDCIFRINEELGIDNDSYFSVKNTGDTEDFDDTDDDTDDFDDFDDTDDIDDDTDDIDDDTDDIDDDTEDFDDFDDTDDIDDFDDTDDDIDDFDDTDDVDDTDDDTDDIQDDFDKIIADFEDDIDDDIDEVDDDTRKAGGASIGFNAGALNDLLQKINGKKGGKRAAEKINAAAADDKGSDSWIEKIIADYEKKESSRSGKGGEGKSEDDDDCSDNNSAPADEPCDLASIVEMTKNIKNTLLKYVLGQDRAINTFVAAFFQSQMVGWTGEKHKSPLASFLFAGSPGVGKTFLAEKAAEALKLPYRRFDMSEYSDKEANIEFCGADGVYSNAKAGNVTGFVANNPRCVLLFDEIEKAHINVIHLFLQILDAGRLRDNHTDREVDFSKTIIIFTTNAGRSLYNDNSIADLSSVPRKKVLRAISSEINPFTGTPMFPAAICSRFAMGNVVMFNRLNADNLYTIAEREINNNISALEHKSGVKIIIDDKVPSAVMFAEGGNADARTVKGRAVSFFYEELYELLRLVPSAATSDTIDAVQPNPVSNIEKILVNVPLEGVDTEISALFDNPVDPEVLIFADEKTANICRANLHGVVCHSADNIDSAMDILFNHDISVVLCDVFCGLRNNDQKLLDAEDVGSSGRDFLRYVNEKYSPFLYILQNEKTFSEEELSSFAKGGVRDVFDINDHSFADRLSSACRMAYRQANMLKLAKENKYLFYKTSQTISEDGHVAFINLFDLRLNLITDVEDSKNVLDNLSKPNIRFDDVIGSEDVKQELKFFVDYLKNPVKFMRKGVRSPRGVLLYGPPGTGKTLLAKAMAGESGVTFLSAEGNEFLKKFVGEGPAAVHTLFNAARKYAPAIVFIDEIDAIAKNRNSLGSEHTAEVLTSFLTEMDGFNTDTSKPVFILAATNYNIDSSKGNSIDPALLRRFDRRVYIDLPDKDSRRKYLQIKMTKNRSVHLSDAQLDSIAMRSTGMSLAELESVFELALRNAIRSKDGIVGDAEFEEAFETFNSGEKKKWSDDSLIRTARHEAGHALVCWLSGEKPSYLTIVARGDHGGYMQHADNENKGLFTKAELVNRMRTSLAGRACEIVYYGKDAGLSTGASGDLFSATKIAEQMICCYGMDETAGLAYIDPDSANGETKKIIHDRVNVLLAAEMNNAINIIAAQRAAIDAVVDALMVKNHLKQDEINAIFTEKVNK